MTKNTKHEKDILKEVACNNNYDWSKLIFIKNRFETYPIGIQTSSFGFLDLYLLDRK